MTTRVVTGLAHHGGSSGAAHRAQNDVLSVGAVLVLVEVMIAVVAARWGIGTGRGGAAVVARAISRVASCAVVGVVLQSAQHKHHAVIQRVELDCIEGKMREFRT